jgi:HEPN domain-containing protein
MDEKSDLVKSWLDKAQHDLASAERLAQGPEPLLDTAIYHCQQAAEKALKGWLVYHDQRPDKTHDVRLLVTLAAERVEGFSELYDSAERLTPYAMAYRYPGELLSPSIQEYLQAYQDAEIVLTFVRRNLPEL